MPAAVTEARICLVEIEMVRLPGMSVCLILGWFCALSPVFAQEDDHDSTVEETVEQELPQSRLYLGSLTVARYHPIGLEAQNRLMYSYMLYDSTSPILRNNFVKIGPSLKINPTGLKLGPFFDLQPLAVLHFRFGYEFVFYFGTLGYMQSYTTSDADYSDAQRDDSKEDSYSTSGHHLFAETTIQMKISYFVARSKFAFAYWDVNLKDGERYFYDGTLDTVIPINELLWNNDTDLLFVKEKLALGVRYSGVFPLTEATHQRIGPVVAWSFNTRDYTTFNRPTLIFLLAWYLEHPNREGGIPYIVLGFSFSSDFWGTKSK
jgi:hypothetical protein